MYIFCALVGAIKDSVNQNARCNSKKKCGLDLSVSGYKPVTIVKTTMKCQDIRV
jgi:hypothetical protein